MNNFNSNNLFVEYRDGANEREPVFSRKYTLTHSDLTAELFLTVGREYAWDKITSLRDEVLAEWKEYGGFPYLYVQVYINGQSDTIVTAKRDEIFRAELPLALKAIYYGDINFFNTYPELKKAPIWIYFISGDPDYTVFENWGTLADYG